MRVEFDRNSSFGATCTTALAFQVGVHQIQFSRIHQPVRRNLRSRRFDPNPAPPSQSVSHTIGSVAVLPIADSCIAVPEPPRRQAGLLKAIGHDPRR